jgi:NitT/TauT family transport system substrate-binding protein
LPTKTYFDHPPTVAKEKGCSRRRASGRVASTGAAAGPSGIAANSADLGTVAVPLVATSRTRGVLAKIVGGVGDEWSGWILGVKTASPVKSAKELEGKKVGITSAGSGTDTLALWAQSEAKATFQRVPVGGGGLVPNLLNDNLAAAVIYSPLSYQVVSEGKVRVLIDFATAMPPNLIGGWTATEKNLTERRPFIQKGLNALYGALEYMRNNPDYAIKTIATNNELPMRDRQDGVREDLPSALPRREDDARLGAEGHGPGRRERGEGHGARRRRVHEHADQSDQAVATGPCGGTSGSSSPPSSSASSSSGRRWRAWDGSTRASRPRRARSWARSSACSSGPRCWRASRSPRGKRSQRS